MSAFKTYALAVAYGVAGASIVADASAQQAPQSGGAVALKEVDIRAFIEDVSNATGRTFIVDPRVTGRVTVIATQTLSERELFDVFLSTLRVNGFAAVPTATGAYRIGPDEVAAREPAPPGAARTADQDRYVTQVFTLRYADSESLANAIRPMLSPRGQVTATRRGNALVVVDFGGTVRRVQEAISQLDQDNSTYRTIRLRNTSAAEMAQVAQGLLAGEGANSSLIQIVPVASSNTLVLRGDQRTLDRYAPLLQELDVGADFRSAIKVIPLKYAVADEVLPVLAQISASLEGAVGGEEGGPAAANRRANIASHKATNSLIISADQDTQEALASVVRSLDVRREQILVEAIIVEVSDSAARDLGIQFLLTGDGDSAVPFLSTSYANTAPNLLALTGALLVKEGSESDNSSLNDLRRAAVSSLLGARGAIGGIGGQMSDGSILGLILNALQEDTQSNVLSTPSIMTLDNETASILVGQQIPITTGETLSDANTNPFRTVAREDVGVELEVTPQISEGGAIRLNIRQEVSSIFGTVSSSSDELITNQRRINTVVQVDAGQVIVLGGLIQDDIQRSDSGIPGLKNIPFAGRLFRSESKSRGRTNLMVFLRPTIVNTPEQAGAVTQRQFNAVRGTQGIDPAIAQRLIDDISDAQPIPVSPSAIEPSAIEPSAIEPSAPEPFAPPASMFSPPAAPAQPEPQ
jgi:general secretion pathway protein D